jgi:23S rRNA (guanosine2251-2'-O)-methyltransferase
MERLPYIVTTAAARYETLRLPVSLMLDNIRSMYNVGSLFRTADGAGVERIYISGITARPPAKGIAKTALGAEERVAWQAVLDSVAEVNRLREAGYEIAALETSVRAVDLFDWQPHWPVCLLLGHEVDGLPADLLERCDTHVRIPMLGLKHSLNVASAGAIAMYELLRKFRELHSTT